MDSIVFPYFPKLTLTKFLRSVRPSIASIILNHPTDWLLQNVDKNTYEKITILRKYADGYAATFTIHSTAGNGEGYLFNSSLLLPTASQTRTRNLWLPSASVYFHLYVIETVQNW